MFYQLLCCTVILYLGIWSSYEINFMFTYISAFYNSINHFINLFYFSLQDDMKHYVPPTDDSGPTDPFLGVMGKEYHGTHRLYGRGVSNKKLKNADALTTSYVVPGDILHSIKTSLLEDLRKDMDREFTREEEKRKEAEEELEKKKADLEKMQQEIENQRDAMTEQIMMKIVGKLPIDIARQYLT